MKWIKVTDQVPKDDETVIFYNEKLKMHSIGWYEKDDDCFFEFNGHLSVEITHWCPLPDAPFYQEFYEGMNE